MKKTMYGVLSTLTLMAGLITTANATLIDNGDGTVTDTSTNLMWLQDANAAGTTMNWNDAMAWVSGLSIGGYTDWRLPTMVDSNNDGCNWSYSGTDCGHNVANSELAYMYAATLGNAYYYDTSGAPAAGWQRDPNNTANGVTIDNLQSGNYWLGQEYAPNPNEAWVFSTSDDGQYPDLKSYGFYAWAVRSADVDMPVPEPSAMALFGLGLLGIAAARRRG